jgi:hypothetical protein
MNAPSTTREALILEALGEAAQLIRRVEALVPALEATRQALVQSMAGMDRQLVAFEHRLNIATGKVKADAVQHVVARVGEAGQRALNDQAKAMSDAARFALGAELGATTQRLQTTLEALLRMQPSPGARWLTHVGVVLASSTLTWLLTTLTR